MTVIVVWFFFCFVNYSNTINNLFCLPSSINNPHILKWYHYTDFEYLKWVEGNYYKNQITQYPPITKHNHDCDSGLIFFSSSIIQIQSIIIFFCLPSSINNPHILKWYHYTDFEYLKWVEGNYYENQITQSGTKTSVWCMIL